MAYTTIDDPTIFFNSVLYTGDGNASQAITGVGHQPDWLWIKARNAGNAHVLQDVVRGISGSKYRFLQSQGTNAEGTSSDNDGVSSLDSDGFTVGYSNSGGWNENAITYVAWNWKAGGTASSNTDGSITSSVSANQTAGFSIATYTGNGTDNATFGHGLSSAPEMVWLKQRNSTGNWRVGATPMDSTFDEVLNLNLTNAKASASTIFSAVAPSSTVVTLGTEGDANGNTNTFVAYCFHSVKGYSKIGKYTGNGSTDGTFVYTGFRPAWVVMKRFDSTNDWFTYDNTRNPFNETNLRISLNSANSESTQTTNQIDMLSNGFKCRGSAAATNTSGGSYLFMAFAESPFVNSKGVPNNAR